MHKKDENKWNLSLETVKFPLLFILIFYGVAFWRYFATGKIFYIYNFMYLGTSLAIGIFLSGVLPKKYVLWGRRITQLLIGIYILGYLGIIQHENMQIEGFLFDLFAGIFAAATLHYFIAKIIGPLIFSRGWCAWACWTAMVLDFLPWKKPKTRIRNLGGIRYLHFFISFGIVSYFWFILRTRDIFNFSTIAVYWLVAGNIFYYVTGICLAAILKDNRAFCKYVCPVPVLQKLTSRFSLLKISIDENKCTECHLCEKNCPMGIELLKYKNEGKRILSTECIMCSVCQDVCPENAVKLSFGFDYGKGREYLRYRHDEEKNK